MNSDVTLLLIRPVRVRSLLLGSFGWVWTAMLLQCALDAVAATGEQPLLSLPLPCCLQCSDYIQSVNSLLCVVPSMAQ